MGNTPLDIYDDMPKYMKKYISNYGWHFNKKAYEYAVSFMEYNDPNTNEISPVKGYTKEEVNNLLAQYGIELKTKIMYDYVFVATMCKADYFNRSILDEYHLCLYIQDTIDDVDASSETTFRRWVATMVGNGDPIDWEELC